MSLFSILLVAYIGGLLLLSWRSNRNGSEEDYLIAGRNRPAWQVMFSKYAASIGAGWMIVYTGFAYEFGAGVVWVFLGGVLGSILYAQWAVPRIYDVTRSAKCYTQGDFVFVLTNSVNARMLVNILAVVMSTLVLVLAAIGGATLMESFGVLSYKWSVLLTVGVVLLYILLSGYKAVMVTDVLQGVLLLGLVTVLALGLLQAEELTLARAIEVREVSLLGLSMLGLYGVLSIFADPNRYQIGYAAKSKKTLQQGMLFTIVPFMWTAFALYLVGVVVYTLDPTLEAAAVFPAAIFNYMPEVLVSFGLLTFFVAIMSSMDSFMYVIASHLESIFSGKVSQTGTRMYVIGTSLVVAGVALVFRDVVDLAVLAGALLFSLSIPMIYLIHFGHSARRFVPMVVGGLFGVVAGVAVFGFEPEGAALVLVGNIIGTLVAPFWYRKNLTSA